MLFLRVLRSALPVWFAFCWMVPAHAWPYRPTVFVAGRSTAIEATVVLILKSGEQKPLGIGERGFDIPGSCEPGERIVVRPQPEAVYDVVEASCLMGKFIVPLITHKREARN